jgi:hypothetical protein
MIGMEEDKVLKREEELTDAQAVFPNLTYLRYLHLKRRIDGIGRAEQ